MKIAIVGAGITGCITAFELSKLKHEISIYDLSKNIGGILRDAEFNGECYFNSCHYLNYDADWLSKILKENHLDVHTFDHNYRSFTEYKDEKIICNDYAGPVFDNLSLKTINKSKINYELNKNNNNITKRFNCYPAVISDYLNHWFNRFQSKDTKLLHENASIATQCNRVYLKGLENNIIELKKESEEINRLYGIPRAYLNPNKPSLRSILPKKGYNYFFKELKNILLKNNCELNLGTPIKHYFDDESKLNIK